MDWEKIAKVNAVDSSSLATASCRHPHLPSDVGREIRIRSCCESTRHHLHHLHNFVGQRNLLKAHLPRNRPHHLLMLRKDCRVLQDDCYAPDALVQHTLHSNTKVS